MFVQLRILDIIKLAEGMGADNIFDTGFEILAQCRVSNVSTVMNIN